MKYWEVIADELSRRGWSWGYATVISGSGRTLFSVDAHRDHGKRYVLRSDELLTAFLELQSQTQTVGIR